MKAPFHPNEKERLALLYSYEILDTPRETDFDDVVALASQICETPISVINLIDADRQWFKAEVGLGMRETPIETSLCAHAILSTDFLEIPDTHADGRMSDNPLCTSDGGLRFYAGALLTTAQGLPLGTLCVLDTRPRELTDLQRTALRVLAAQVMKQLDLRLALRRMDVMRREADHRIKNSLSLITSLIRLQMRGISDDETRSALAVVQNRIATLAALHAALSDIGDGGEVQLDAYLEQVASVVQQSIPDTIQVTASFDPCPIAPSRAASVAMIVSEWLMNAVKHAFPANGRGHIDLRGRLRDDQYFVTIKDDGVGLGSGVRPGGIGLDVIEASRGQVSGVVKVLRMDRGTGWQLTLPISATR